MHVDWSWVGPAANWLANTAERYQTILAALLAIWAAKIAVRPIWQQVTATNTQTQIAHLATLQKLLSDAIQRSENVDRDFAEPLRQMNWCLFDPAGEPQEVDGATAHGLSNQTSGALDWYLVTLAGTESANVEAAKAALQAALDDLNHTLGTIEWVDHNEQSGEDYAYTDEEWVEVLASAAAASKEASPKGSAVSKAFYVLRAAQAETITHLRTQIRNIEHALAKLG